MAKIVPYGDLNAHGSLAGSVSFRRRFNYVVFQKKPHPKQPNTPGQIAQRTAFKNALNDWYFLNPETKFFYNSRGPQLGLTGMNLYIRQKLLNDLPSTTPIVALEITAVVLGQLRATLPNSGVWEFQDTVPEYSFGNILDPTNIWNQSHVYVSNTEFTLRIESDGDDYAIFFRDYIAITIIISGPVTKNILIRLPKVTIADGNDIMFFLADDGSLYWDSAMTKLACVSKF